MSEISNGNDGLDSRANLALWADDPSEIDLLSFKPVADTVVEALLDDHLDPIALGVSGRWGSGKSTILNFILEELENHNIDKEPKILVISTDPWRYDPSSGVKETLISEVLTALAAEAAEHTTSGDGASKLKNLMGRVDWAKALKIAAKTSITFQIPNVNDLLHLLKPPDQRESSGDVQGLESFRREFKDLMQETNHIRRVVVLVDDLDRCLPPTVVATLETIRLFLAVPKMSFVIAADEELVANAIRTRYGGDDRQISQMSDGLDEEPAKLYLHKIVQTTVPVPTLSRFDTEAYIFLLQMLVKHDDDRMKHLIDECVSLRQQTKELADLPPDDEHGTHIGELSLAERLTPILYEKLQGNPRRIKRFLNDLTIRQSIATRRGINLHTGIVAKMMVLEQLLPDEFRTVLDWVAEGVLREQMVILEHIAGGIVDIQASDKDAADTTDTTAVIDSETNQGRPDEQDNRIFSDALLRWGKLAPALHDVDLSPYLHLAATFRGELVLTGALPERLRDLAANLCSDVTSKRRSVSDSDLEQLPIGDAKKLLSHLGRLAKDRPGEQKEMVEGILRISRRQPVLVRHTCNVLSSIPADEVRPSSPMLFASKDRELRPVLESWRAKATKKIVRNAIDKALKDMN